MTKPIFEAREKNQCDYHILRISAKDIKTAIKKIALKKGSYLISERKDLRPYNKRLVTN